MKSTSSPATGSDAEDIELLGWQANQGYIVTGGGKVVSGSSIYTHFHPSDLPHFLLQRKISRRAFAIWKSSGRVSQSIIGCWSRPIFCGGWKESSNSDTDAYNLQTPSLFIDMRFPTMRPTDALRNKASLEDCSEKELRILSRQHCFAGYSLPEIATSSTTPLTFTRHHVIDWNYHRGFPRNRPNRWWVEVQEPSRDSFKEHSSVRDENGVPVYFERWQRREPATNQSVKYMALRKVRPCPEALRRSGRTASSGELRDAVLIVVGCHFAIAIDRNYASIDSHLESERSSLQTHCKGGGGFFIDYLLQSDYPDKRRVMADYLSLEGSYGRISHGTWLIEKSTHPWNEQQSLFSSRDSVEIKLDANNIPVSILWDCKHPTRGEMCSSSWEVIENSFDIHELLNMFPNNGPFKSKL